MNEVYYMLERRSGRNADVEDSCCYLTDDVKDAEKWMFRNKDYGSLKSDWWWVILKIKMRDPWGSELYRVYDRNGDQIENQPIYKI